MYRLAYPLMFLPCCSCSSCRYRQLPIQSIFYSRIVLVASRPRLISVIHLCIISQLINQVSFLIQTGFSIQILRTDNGTEFKNAETTEWVLEIGIRHETSCVYTPEQNGIAEKANPMIMEMTRCILCSGNAPPLALGRSCLICGLN